MIDSISKGRRSGRSFVSFVISCRRSARGINGQWGRRVRRIRDMLRVALGTGTARPYDMLILSSCSGWTVFNSRASTTSSIHQGRSREHCRPRIVSILRHLTLASADTVGWEHYYKNSMRHCIRNMVYGLGRHLASVRRSTSTLSCIEQLCARVPFAVPRVQSSSWPLRLNRSFSHRGWICQHRQAVAEAFKELAERCELLDRSFRPKQHPDIQQAAV